MAIYHVKYHFPIIYRIFIIKTYCQWMLVLQVVLKFKCNFWQKIVQGADFFGHVPHSSEGRGHCGLFYDLCKKVTFYHPPYSCF